jgi:hypothetical protein
MLIMACSDRGGVTFRAILFGGVLLGAAAIACEVSAAGAFDGTYVGQAALMSGNNGSICKTFNASMTVANDRLSYVHGGGYAVINTDVAADGSFSGSAPLNANRGKGGVSMVETLKGKVTGSTLEADASNPGCSFHLVLKKAS